MLPTPRTSKGGDIDDRFVPKDDRYRCHCYFGEFAADKVAEPAALKQGSCSVERPPSRRGPPGVLYVRRIAMASISAAARGTGEDNTWGGGPTGGMVRARRPSWPRTARAAIGCADSGIPSTAQWSRTRRWAP